MKKILIVYNYILHYRKPFFNELAKKYDVTVLHSGKISVDRDDAYKEIITPVRKVGPFYFQKGVLKEVRKHDYDIVISLFDVRWLAILIFLLFKDGKKIHILWGAWITKNKSANIVRRYFLRKVDANVFYTYEAMSDFSMLNIQDNKMFVANNTFDVGERVKSYECTNKFRVLFVGSLMKRKENEILLRAYAKVRHKIPKNIVLTFIGDGPEKLKLAELSTELGLSEFVQFLGAINDSDVLREFYRETIVAISFGQAGLAVLQSMGFGVPFLTKRNAISGGEKSNIKDGLNGAFCEDSQDSLEEFIVKFCNDIEYSRDLGRCAYEYYSEYCTIQNMTQGFIDAIEGTRLARVDCRLKRLEN